MKTFITSCLIVAITMAQEHRVLKASPEVRVFGDHPSDYDIPAYTSSDEGILSLSTRTMYNGLSKATHLVGCSLQSGVASLPGVSGGSGYRFKSQRVGYAHYCGKIENETPVDPNKPTDPVVEPEEKQPDNGAFANIASSAVALAAAMSLFVF